MSSYKVVKRTYAIRPFKVLKLAGYTDGRPSYRTICGFNSREQADAEIRIRMEDEAKRMVHSATRVQ